MSSIWQKHRHREFFFMNLTVIPSGFLSVNTIFIPLAGTDAQSGSRGIPVVVVDPGDERCVSELAQRNMEPLAVVLTHGHFDHVLGLGAVKKHFPAIPVAVHTADKILFGTGMPEKTAKSLLGLGLEQEIVDLLQSLPEADMCLAEGTTLDALFSGAGNAAFAQAAAAWRVLETPGHTPGSVCLYNESAHTLISGDTMFEGTWGRTDLPGGNDKTMVRSLKRLFSELPGNTGVYPGHGNTGFTLAENPLPV
jgi:glyoxylase-like metal-dependent hydrolase (beta-lactamase superfamily II)